MVLYVLNFFHRNLLRVQSQGGKPPDSFFLVQYEYHLTWLVLLIRQRPFQRQ